MKTSVIEVHDMLAVLTVAEVEKRIRKVPGVASATVNYAAGNATVRYDETLLKIADIKVLVHQRAQKSEGESPSEDVSEHKPAHKHAVEPTPEGASASASPPGPAAPKAATVQSPAIAASTAPASEGQAGKPKPGAPPSPAAAKPSA